MQWSSPRAPFLLLIVASVEILGAVLAQTQDEAGGVTIQDKTSSGCDVPCVLNGETASCRDRVHWLIWNTPQGPLESYRQVLETCPGCDRCLYSAVYETTPAQPTTTTITTTTLPFDCDFDFPWVDRWDIRKKAWCCAARGRGCFQSTSTTTTRSSTSSTSTQTSSTSSTSTSTRTSTTMTSTTSSSSTSSTSSSTTVTRGFLCVMNKMAPEEHIWCCEHKNLWCDSIDKVEKQTFHARQHQNEDVQQPSSVDDEVHVDLYRSRDTTPRASRTPTPAEESIPRASPRRPVPAEGAEHYAGTSDHDLARPASFQPFRLPQFPDDKGPSWEGSTSPPHIIHDQVPDPVDRFDEEPSDLDEGWPPTCSVEPWAAQWPSQRVRRWCCRHRAIGCVGPIEDLKRTNVVAQKYEPHFVVNDQGDGPSADSLDEDEDGSWRRPEGTSTHFDIKVLAAIGTVLTMIPTVGCFLVLRQRFGLRPFRRWRRRPGGSGDYVDLRQAVFVSVEDSETEDEDADLVA